jgi:hypothetical protein
MKFVEKLTTVKQNIIQINPTIKREEIKLCQLIMTKSSNWKLYKMKRIAIKRL